MKTLLIVDDEAKICEVLSRFFTARGFRTTVVASGQDAVEALASDTPDYLLLDVRLPDFSGLEVLRFAKTYHPNVKVVIVSALTDQETTEAAYRLGALDYVTKPFELDDSAWARAFFSDEPPGPN